MTFKELENKVGYTLNQSDWSQHKNGGAWVHKNAKVNSDVFIGEFAIVWGGTIEGGTIWGGTIEGGTIEDGEWKQSVLFLMDPRGHGATNSKPGYLRIGCEIHTFSEWKTRFPAIARKHNLTSEEEIEYKAIIDLFCKIGK